MLSCNECKNCSIIHGLCERCGCKMKEVDA